MEARVRDVDAAMKRVGLRQRARALGSTVVDDGDIRGCSSCDTPGWYGWRRYRYKKV